MTDGSARALAREYDTLRTSAQGTDFVDSLATTFLRVYCEGTLDARRATYDKLAKRAEALTLRLLWRLFSIYCVQQWREWHNARAILWTDRRTWKPILWMDRETRKRLDES